MLALAAIVAGVSAANVWWIRRDAAPWPHPRDPYVYLANTLRFVDELGAQGWSDPGGALTRLSFEGRPPLYQLLSVPFVLVGGRSEDAALLVNVLLVVVLLACVYGIGRIAANGRAGSNATSSILFMSAFPKRGRS